MKLTCKITPKYMQQILDGKKNIEYRQVESIIFKCGEDKKYEFEVSDISVYPKEKDLPYPNVTRQLRKRYPDIDWRDDLQTFAIFLGKRVKEKKKHGEM